MKPNIQPVVQEIVRKDKQERKLYLNKNMEHSLNLVSSRVKKLKPAPIKKSEESLVVSKEKYINNLSFRLIHYIRTNNLIAISKSLKKLFLS